MSNFDRVIEEAEKFLEKEGAISRDRSKSGAEIVNKLSANDDLHLTRGSLFSYLSTAANDESLSRIVSGGPRSGYWLSKAVAGKPRKIQNETVDIISGKKAEKFSEKDLYPLVELWMGTKQYRSKDTSGMKSGGKWGNPDIIGLNRIQTFGISDIEVASCEVKIDIANWEQYIFEAISHKRFSNRSYFCFRVKEQAPITDAMAFYAEKFRIGIVQILLSDDEALEIKEVGSDSKQLERYLENFQEFFPALYDSVSAQEKANLLDRLSIKDEKTFYAFGKEY